METPPMAMAAWRVLDETALHTSADDALTTFLAGRGRAGEAAWNMALDEALLDSIAAGQSPPTLRLYRWQRPAVTLGRFQSVSRTIRLDACSRLDVPLARRLSGGRGILHGDDLTVSLICSQAALGFSDNEDDNDKNTDELKKPGVSVSVLDLYSRLAQIWERAFADCGIAARQGSCTRENRTQTETRGDCFANASRADLIAADTGRKLLGAALHRRGAWLLLQASIPLSQDFNSEQAQIAGAVFSGYSGPSPRLKDKTAEPGFAIEASALSVALRRALAAATGAGGESSSPTPEEFERARSLVCEKYGTPEWTQNGQLQHAPNCNYD